MTIDTNVVGVQNGRLLYGYINATESRAPSDDALIVAIAEYRKILEVMEEMLLRRGEGDPEFDEKWKNRRVLSKSELEAFLEGK